MISSRALSAVQIDYCCSLSWRGCRLFGESSGRLEGGDKAREEVEGREKEGVNQSEVW